MDAIGYICVSTQEQASQGLSLEAQEAQVRAYCAFRALDLVRIVRDEGVSATRALRSREGGAMLEQFLAQSAPAAVVALSLDRLFCRTVDALTTAMDWMARGIEVLLTNEAGQAIDTSSAFGWYMLAQRAALGQLESDLTSERTRAAMRHARRSGRRVGAVPYGYVLEPDGKTLQPDPEEQAVIARMRRWRKQGRSYRWIANRLGRLGVPTKTGGERWAPYSVQRILDGHGSRPVKFDVPSGPQGPHGPESFTEGP
jgi:DNA invertase Pin-like site-specific DNA recombinase